jgi:hypothetical protein
MKKIALVLALQILVLPLVAAEGKTEIKATECALCAGVIAPAAPPAAPIPVIESASIDELTALAERVDRWTPAQRKQALIVFTFTTDPAAGDPLLQVETHTKSLVEWARLHGPFDALAVNVDKLDAVTGSYAIKRLSVTAQGQNVATRIAFAPSSLAALPKYYDNGAGAYFDVLLVNGSDVADAAKWLAEHDPVKKVWARVEPASANPLYDAARALAAGATRAFLGGADARTAAAVAAFNQAMIGDYAYDATAKNAVLDAKGNATTLAAATFIRGEDLRTLVVPQGDAAAATIVSMDSDRFTAPRVVDAAGVRSATDTGSKGGHFLIGIPPAKNGPIAVSLDHAEKIDANVTKEAIDVTTKRGITVEEIIRNHQAYKSYQESIQPRYVARDTTKLRFSIGDGGEAVEATIAGDYFSDPQGRADWVWQDFFLNGVRWKYGRIPELPLIQPEKVTQLPLDIHLTNEYRYQFVRETDLLGYHVYEVRFDPPPNAVAGLPLYRGTVWIDTKSWARIRISMIQLNLTGEVLSNEERVDFVPFARATHVTLTPAQAAQAEAREVLWLPVDVQAQQVVSAAGRANAVLRATTFSDFRIEPADFELKLAEAERSDARMVRETKAGLRYLDKTPEGTRVVKEGFDTSRTFLLGGIHHDAGLDYPVVPLGGIDYFNFNLGGTGIQTNVFFAGVIVAANATNPNVHNTRTNLSADFFGIAVPFTNSLFRNGVERTDEAVKTLPIGLTLRAGHPVFQFGKIDVSFNVTHLTYQRADDTAAGYVIPSDTFILNPGIQAQYARWGWTATGSYDYNRRTTWEAWGSPGDYDPKQKAFTKYVASLGKSFYLPKFQRIGADINYLGGSNLDRFSKYELGFFGAQRVHGVESGSVRAEKAILGHLSYGFVFSDQFRLEAFYDHALIDDATAGYHREPFQGLGLGGQTVGPYGTLLRLDLGKTIGRNKQSGFVANVVVLKLF